MNRFTVRRAFRCPSRPEWGAGAIAPAPQVTASGVPENAAIRGTRGVILAWAKTRGNSVEMDSMATNACHEVPDMKTEPAIPASSNVDTVVSGYKTGLWCDHYY